MSNGNSKLRLLVIAPAQVDGRALREQVEQRAGSRPAEVYLVCPAVTESKLKHTFGDVDEAVDEAEGRLSASIEGLRSERVAAAGAVGDADPLVATEDALGRFPDPDEILIVTHRGDEAEWFEEDLFDRAAERFEPPVAHIELSSGAGDDLREVESSGRGLAGEEPDEGELELSENLPPFSRRDLFGIFVAIVGTIVLALLAADSGDGGVSPARTLIAIAFALVNLAHVVGLVFFNSQKYRGLGRTQFANLSLFGTPLAIVVSALI